MSNENLTISNKIQPKHKMFADEYLIDLDKTAAALRAGYKDTINVRITAQKIFERPEVKAYIEAQLKDIAQRLNLRAEDVIKEIKEIGFSDIKNYLSFNKKGVTFKNSDDLDCRVISEVSSKRTSTKKMGGDETIITETVDFKMKLYDKMKALEMLSKYFKLYTDNDGNQKDTVSNVTVNIIQVNNES